MKLKQKSLILNVFSKAVLAALLLSGLQPVLVSANAFVNSFDSSEQAIVTMQSNDLSAPVHTVEKQLLPDLQKSFNEAAKNNFVQLTFDYSFSQDTKVALENIEVIGAVAQKEVHVQKLATANIQIAQNKTSFSIYKLSQQTQNDQPVIAANRVELPSATQTAQAISFTLIFAAVIILLEQTKTKNSLQFEVLRC